ncbi:MAG: hypothetical protein ACE5RN_07015 [Nitrosopumilaceae archaeon]
MDILNIAEDNFIISFGIVIVIGLIHGAILGRGIRNRFPSLKKHARIVSLVLLALFSINAVANIIKFAIPEKTPVSEFTIPTTPEEGLSFLINLLGLDAGLGAVIVLFISISLILFFKLAQIPKIARYFIFTLSVIVLLVALLARFTDYIPTSFQVQMYAFYQFGITLGIFLVTRRKEHEVRNFS